MKHDFDKPVLVPFKKTNEDLSFEDSLFMIAYPGSGGRLTKPDDRFVRGIAARTFFGFMKEHQDLLHLTTNTDNFTVPFISDRACLGRQLSICRALCDVHLPSWTLRSTLGLRQPRVGLNGCVSCATLTELCGSATVELPSCVYQVQLRICAFCGDYAHNECSTIDKRKLASPHISFHRDCWMTVRDFLYKHVRDYGTQQTCGYLCELVANQLLEQRPALRGFEPTIPPLADDHKLNVQAYLEMLPSDPHTVVVMAVRLHEYRDLPQEDEGRRRLWDVNAIPDLARRVGVDNLPIIIPKGDIYIARDMFQRTGAWGASLVAGRLIGLRAQQTYCPDTADMVAFVNMCLERSKCAYVSIVFDSIYDAGPVDVMMEFIAAFRDPGRVSIVFKHIDPYAALQATTDMIPIRIDALCLAEAFIQVLRPDNSTAGRVIYAMQTYQKLIENRKFAHRMKFNVDISFDSEAGSGSPSKTTTSTGEMEDDDPLTKRNLFLLSIENGPVIALVRAGFQSQRLVFTVDAQLRAKQAFEQRSVHRVRSGVRRRREGDVIALVFEDQEDHEDHVEETEVDDVEDERFVVDPNDLKLPRTHGRVQPGLIDTLIPHVGKEVAENSKAALLALLAFHEPEIDADFLEQAGINVTKLALGRRNSSRLEADSNHSTP